MKSDVLNKYALSDSDVKRYKNLTEELTKRDLNDVELAEYNRLFTTINANRTKILNKYSSIAKHKPLPNKDSINRLLNIRKKGKKSGYNKNTAILEVDVLIEGEKRTLVLEGLAGQKTGGSKSGLVESVNKDVLKSELDLNSVNSELSTNFQALDEGNELVTRLYDSEHKMLEVADDIIHKLFVKFGEENVKVSSMRLDTLYTPCSSCQKQIIARSEYYGVIDIEVRAVSIGGGKYARDNTDLLKIGKK